MDSMYDYFINLLSRQFCVQLINPLYSELYAFIKTIIYIKILVKEQMLKQADRIVAGASSPGQRQSYYFLFFLKSIAFGKNLASQVQTKVESNGAFKFSIYKGPQIFNSTRQTIELQIKKEPIRVQKVELSFFLKDFNVKRKIQFIAKMLEIVDEIENLVGEINIEANKYIEQYITNGNDRVEEQAEMGPFHIQYVIFTDKNRHSLQKLVKAYKQSPEYVNQNKQQKQKLHSQNQKHYPIQQSYDESIIKKQTKQAQVQTNHKHDEHTKKQNNNGLDKTDQAKYKQGNKNQNYYQRQQKQQYKKQQQQYFTTKTGRGIQQNIKQSTEKNNQVQGIKAEAKQVEIEKQQEGQVQGLNIDTQNNDFQVPSISVHTVADPEDEVQQQIIQDLKKQQQAAVDQQNNNQQSVSKQHDYSKGISNQQIEQLVYKGQKGQREVSLMKQVNLNSHKGSSSLFSILQKLGQKNITEQQQTKEQIKQKEQEGEDKIIQNIQIQMRTPSQQEKTEVSKTFPTELQQLKQETTEQILQAQKQNEQQDETIFKIIRPINVPINIQTNSSQKQKHFGKSSQNTNKKNNSQKEQHQTQKTTQQNDPTEEIIEVKNNSKFTLKTLAIIILLLGLAAYYFIKFNQQPAITNVLHKSKLPKNEKKANTIKKSKKKNNKN